MELTFFGRRLLILGGSCDPAITLAEAAIGEGLFPVLTWRSEEGRERIVAGLGALSNKFETVRFELGSRSALDSLFEPPNDAIDYLVDFAQGDLEGLIGSTNSESVERYFFENISFRAEVLRRAARIMLKNRRGRLIFISSSAALRPNPGQGFYAAAKLACEALYKNLGLELSCRGISAMSLRPGYIDSGRGKKYLETHHDQAIKAIPSGRVLSSREVAESVLFFLSDCASGFNATEISLDGGLTAGK